MRKRLGELVEIRTGYPFRRRIVRLEKGGCKLVQMGDVRAETGEIGDNLGHVEAPANWQRYRLQPRDVLLVGRGMRNEAAMFVGQADDVIALPHLLVLRVRRSGAVLPAFLTWFLNLPETQERIRAMRRGTDVAFVPIENLEELEVPLPGAKDQRIMAEVHLLSLREQEVLREVARQRKRLLDGKLQQKVMRINEGNE